jgi:G3E family GTPase
MPNPSPQHARIPVTLLTGFLGSGKTTLANALLRDPALADTAVIVNELGAIGLDHLLIAAGDDNIKLLDSGCLCCAMQNTLADTLADLFVRRVNGGVPRFRRVLVETSGLADPGPIASQLATDALVRAEFALAAIVTCVDGVNGAAQLDTQREAVRQAALADVLIVTKTDLGSADAVNALEQRLHALNPHAQQLRSAQGRVSADLVLGVARREAHAPHWLGVGMESTVQTAEEDYRRLTPVGALVHDDNVRSAAIALDQPITWTGLDAWMSLARETFGQRLLRAKGIVGIVDRHASVARPFVVHGVAGYFHRPEPLPAWPSADQRSRLIMIARDVAEHELRRSFKALALPEDAGRPHSLAELEEMHGI